MTPTFRRHARPVGRVLPMDRVDAQFWAERDRRSAASSAPAEAHPTRANEAGRVKESGR